MLLLDVSNDESTIILGMDINKYSVTDNLSIPSTIKFKRPQDREAGIFPTYISGNTPLTKLLRLSISPVIPTTAGLLGKPTPLQSIRPTTHVESIHNDTHATTVQNKQICKEPGWLHENPEK